MPKVQAGVLDTYHLMSICVLPTTCLKWRNGLMTINDCGEFVLPPPNGSL